MRSFLILLGFIAVSGCTTLNTSLRGNSAQHLCSIAPSLNICVDPPEELTASVLKQRMDKEYAYLKEAGQQFSREYSASALAAAYFQELNPEYIYLRNRLLKEVNKTSNENGRQSDLLATISNAAHIAGDKETVLSSIHTRRTLIRNRPQDQDWARRIADFVFHTSKAESWEYVFIDAATFGNTTLAIDILHEAFPQSDRGQYKYHLNLAAIYIASSQFDEAEEAAKKAMKAYHSNLRARKYPNDYITASKYLIESLARQNKSYDTALKNLRHNIVYTDASLSEHAAHFFELAGELAPYAPSGAAEFLAAGQIIYSASKSDGFPDRGEESDACDALKNIQCLLDIANDQQISVVEIDSFWLDTIARTYILAADYDSAKHLLDRVSEGCGALAYFLATERLIESKRFTEANDWLDRWVLCQSQYDPNDYSWSMSATRWRWIVYNYTNLSEKLSEAGFSKDALATAKTAYLLLLEAERSWENDNGNYSRATDFGQMHGAVYGALVMTERAQ